VARLYSNENVARAIVVQLRELSHDVLTSHEAGNANQQISDEEVLEFACSDNRAVLTNNRLDFLRLHRSGDSHCGIVVYTTDMDFLSLAERIDAALEKADLSRRFLIRVTKTEYSVE